MGQGLRGRVGAGRRALGAGPAPESLGSRAQSLLYCRFPVVPEELVVKEAIHPKYFEVEARCACGATWKTHSTKPELHLEICSNCHPFFTGRQKLIDTEGRVDRFTKRFGAMSVEERKKSAAVVKAASTAKAKKASKAAKG